MKKKISLTTAIFLLSSILLSSFVFAFAIATSYTEDNPLKLSPGQTGTAYMRLQNMEEGDEVVIAEISQGNEIASLEETEFIVKSGTKNTAVPIKITLPSETSIGTKYLVKVSFKSKIPGAAGGVAFGKGYNMLFNVLVVSESPEEPEQGIPRTGISTSTWIIAIFIIAIIAIIIILLRRKSSNLNLPKKSQNVP